jgi:hypothetical protein
MGLEASVMCTCYARGIAAPFPFPERLVMNSDGFPDLLPSPGADPEEDMRLLATWMADACEHPGMTAARAYVSNWADYRAFLAALGNTTPEAFNTLIRELPMEDEIGVTTAQAAAEALQELDAFEAREQVGENIFVVDADSGEKLYAYVPEYDGIFVWDGRNGYNIGVDSDGLFFVDAWELGRVVFRARSIEQHLLDPELTEAGGDGRIEYVDPDSGRRLECKTPIPGKEIPWPDGRERNDEGRFRLHYPRHITVEQRPLTPADFSNITSALRRLFAASIETDNPVRWH